MDRALVRALGLGYVGRMGMGSLTKYRRLIMGIGLVIFLGGAVGRWHRNRTMGTLATKQGRGPAEVWRSDCLAKACSILQVPGEECESVCDQAMATGVPNTPAERMAFACDKYCSNEAPNDPSCGGNRLILEANQSANH